MSRCIFSEANPKHSWIRVKRSVLDSEKGIVHSVTETVIGLPLTLKVRLLKI